MASLKTFEELIAPDERTLRFSPLGFSTAGALAPEAAAEFQQLVIAGCELNSDVPDDTRNSFERVRMLHSYGILFYEAFTLAEDLSWLVMEQAFRERFVTYFDGAIPLVNVKTRESDVITAKSFEDVYQAVNRRGPYSSRQWELVLRSTGKSIEFRGTFFHLLKWARAEGLLHGQRNKATEEVYRRIRNRVAHPSYHLGMPPDSARRSATSVRSSTDSGAIPLPVVTYTPPHSIVRYSSLPGMKEHRPLSTRSCGTISSRRFRNLANGFA